jgi:hypothetical protein
MTPKEAEKLIGRRIVAVDLGRSWETDLHGGGRVLMHMHPSIALDDGSVLRFLVEEHPSGTEYGVDFLVVKPRRVAKTRA